MFPTVGSEGQYSPRQCCVTKSSLAPNLWGDWKLCLLLRHSQHVRVLRLLPDPGERTLFKLCLSEFPRVIWLQSPGIRWHQGEWWCGRPWRSTCISLAGPAHAHAHQPHCTPLHCALCPLATLNYCALTSPASGVHCLCSFKLHFLPGMLCSTPCVAP